MLGYYVKTGLNSLITFPHLLTILDHIRNYTSYETEPTLFNKLRINQYNSCFNFALQSFPLTVSRQNIGLYVTYLLSLF